MRYKYWSSPKRTVVELVLKLNEEAGEVAKAILLMAEGRQGNTLEELGHVEFIAKCIRERMT